MWYGVGQLFEVASDAVRLTQLAGARDDPGELAEGAEQVALAVVGQQRWIEHSPDRRSEPEISGVAQQRRDAGMGVLDVEDRVVVGLA